MRIEGSNSYPIHQNPQDRIGKVHEGIDNLKKGPVKYRNWEKEIIDGIESANEKIEIYNRRLEFSIHEKTKDIMIKIVDSDTDEVIREIPPKKILDLVANMLERAGLLVDEKA